MELGAVRAATAPETPALHDALETLALGDGLDIHEADALEGGHAEALADSGILAEITHLAKDLRGSHALRELSAIGLGDVILLLLVDAEDDGAVAILLLRLLGDHDVGMDLDDRNGHELPGRVEDLGHPDLLADKSEH